MQTTIQKWGNSQGVRIPKTLLDSVFLRENDAVEIVAEKDTLVIRKAGRKRRARISLEERFEGYTGDYKCTELDSGPPVGEEVF